MRLTIDVDDNDYNLLSKTEIQIDLSTAFYGKEKDRKMTFALFNLAKALKNGTPISNEGDLISREALKKEIDTGGCNDYDKYDFIEAIDNAPTVAVNCKDCDGYEAGYSAGLKDEERPQGEWNEWTDERWGGTTIYCPYCKENALKEYRDGLLRQVKSNFCPNCGARMEE